MIDKLEQTAINLALQGKWQEAIQVNLDILKEDKENISTLCRLSKAYFETGDKQKAQKYANKALEIDVTNKIASKMIERCNLNPDSTPTSTQSSSFDPSIFIEEAGKTRVTNLVNVSSSKTIKLLNPGEELNIVCLKHNVNITTKDNVNVGKLPDDIAARIRQLVKIGNQYKAYFKAQEKQSLKIILREHIRSNKMSEIHSFPINKSEVIEELGSDLK